MRTSEAAARLGVKPQTLYSYVSRGLLSRERTAGGSTFDAREVEHLARTARNAGGVPRAERPLAFVTELTLIEDGRLYYRGRDAVGLAAAAQFEAVGEWLWSGRWPERDAGAVAWWDPTAGGGVEAADAVVRALPERATLLARLSAATVAAGSADPMRHDRSATGVAAVGRRLLWSMVAAVTPPGAGVDPGCGVAAALAGALAARAGAEPPGDAGVDAVRAALVLMADHELAPSTLAVRVAASLGADPYAAVLCGLGAVGGTRHGGASVEVYRMLRDAEAGGGPSAVGDRLARAGGLPGFGMVLYPGGDPRGAALLERALAIGGGGQRRVAVEAVLDALDGRDVAPPNCDFGLAAAAYVLGLGPEAGEAMFVIGRTAGWLAHAAEEYSSPSSFRVRAAYTGTRPIS
ncbi:MerR family transcriptional regulator [Acidiferrimicrobium sp. IK]|nr:MerR family transcriptional regulator [Acidiferrimicrobium sp. IK]